MNTIKSSVKIAFSIFSAMIIMVFLPVTISALETDQTEGVEDMTNNNKSSEKNNHQKNMDFLIENYNLSAEELENIDLDRFIEDYNLYTLEYTADEVQQILSDERDMYIDDGSTERLKLFEMKSDDTLTPDQGIRRIGYYYNEGTLLQIIIFDFQENVWYVNDEEPCPMTSDDVSKLLSLEDKYHVFQWDSNYEGKEASSTGSLRWKLVYEFDDGSCRSFGGYTKDMSHLPENFREVDTLIRSIIK